MFKAVLPITFLTFVVISVVADKKIVCYYGSWSAMRPDKGKFEVSDIDPSLCTHMIYSFVGLTIDGDVKVLDNELDLPNGKDGYGKFTKLRELNPNVKAMIAMGGWNEGSIKYSQIFSDPTTRAQYVQNVIAFLKKYNFDGFDIDWEYPNQRGGRPADKENFVSVLKELREEFDKHGFILSVAVAAIEESASRSYIIPQISKYVHFINLMSYDFSGSWDKVTGQNAPLHAGPNDQNPKLNVDSAVNYWLSQGAPADKLLLGIPTYGRSFTLMDPNQTDVGSPITGPGAGGPYTRQPGMLGYNEICENLDQGWSVKRYKEHATPFAFKDNQWVGYDDVESVQEKAKYIESMGLGGAMVWSIETDDFHGSCGEKYPLLKALNNIFKGVNPAPLLKLSVTESSKPETPTTTPAVPMTPPASVCVDDGFAVDPHDCSKFYRCEYQNDRYIAHAFSCGLGLGFDPSFSGCNYAHLVPNCWTKTG